MAQVTARKRGSFWEYRYEGISVNGKRKQFSKSGFKTKKEALDAGAQALSAYNRSGIAFEPKRISFSDFANFWIKNYVDVHVRPSSKAIYLNALKNHILPYFGIYELSAIKRDAVIIWINKLSQALSKKSIEIAKTILSEIFNFALDLDYVSFNPVSRIRIPDSAKTSREKKPLSPENFNTLMQRVFPPGNPYRIAICLGWYCGLRLNEAISLTWDDVDFEKGIIHVRKQIVDGVLSPLKTKTSERDIYFGDSLREILLKERAVQNKQREKYKEYYATYEVVSNKVIRGDNALDFVCRRENGERILDHSLKTYINFHKNNLDFPFSFHVLRHSHATLLVENGASLKAVQARLGHSTSSITMDIYTHCTERQSKEASAIFESICPRV